MEPTIISYRSQADELSHFLNIEDLMKCDDFEKIKKIYDDIFCSVIAYDPHHVESLIKVENRLHNRILSLETEKKEDLQKAITDWKEIAFSILTLGVRHAFLISSKHQVEEKIKQTNKAHSKFASALNKTKQRILEKELHPKSKIMKRLEKQRLADPDQELARLKSVPRIAKSLEKVEIALSKNQKVAAGKFVERGKTFSKSEQIAFGRSVELREYLKDTHYVINHGQNLELMLVSIITRKLKQEFEPQYYESFEPLRHESALRHVKDDIHTSMWFQNLVNQGKVNDRYLSKELICGDCVLESITPGESALDYFFGRINIACRDNPSLVYDLLLSITQNYFTDQKTTHKLCTDLVGIMNSCPEGGNLYSICIPKEKFSESCYFARPYGTPLKDQDHLSKKIEEMQSGEEPCGNPQVRILSHKIQAQDGFYLILNSTLSADQLLKIDEEVSLCIQAALTGYRVPSSPKKIF